MDDLTRALLYASLAGAALPLGALIARFERIRPDWLEQEFRHAVVAFGGGALLAAVGLVLAPEGAARLAPWPMLACLLAGGVVFMAIDRLIEARGGAAAQLIAALADFVPEALALGAMLATGEPAGLLLALLIALQNLPEGFNAYREVKAHARMPPGLLLLGFALLAALGPLAAWAGYELLDDRPEALGAVMLFAAGGILYLTFEDIAPEARLDRRWAPPLGAVCGFGLGLIGHALTG